MYSLLRLLMQPIAGTPLRLGNRPGPLTLLRYRLLLGNADVLVSGAIFFSPADSELLSNPESHKIR
jgi:hypothetical protein